MKRRIFATITTSDGRSIEVDPPEWVCELAKDIEGLEYVLVKTSNEVATFTCEIPKGILEAQTCQQ
jgi:hypothetical protein